MSENIIIAVASVMIATFGLGFAWLCKLYELRISLYKDKLAALEKENRELTELNQNSAKSSGSNDWTVKDSPDG